LFPPIIPAQGTEEVHIPPMGLLLLESKMLKRILPYLNRPDVEFVLECVSFILFSAVFLNWVAHL